MHRSSTQRPYYFLKSQFNNYNTKFQESILFHLFLVPFDVVYC